MKGRLARLLVCVLGGVLVSASPALACDLPLGETAIVASILDGETLELTDGRAVRLLGVKAPAPPLGWTGEEPWPFVADAKVALDRLASGAKVELRFDARREDRHGHVLAQVFLLREGTQVWLQEALVAQGFARVYSLADTRACVPALLAAERKAREQGRGLWRSWAYRVQDAGEPERLGRLPKSYQLVEGTVHAIGEGRTLIYLNFAEDWKRDFTIIERKTLARFEAAGLDLGMLAGKRVRVRGFVEWWNGPMIAATHPEQIEVLPPSPAG